MKKIMNELLNVDKKILLFLIIICIMGIISGSIFMAILDANDKNMIIESLESFLLNIGYLNTKIELINNILINLLYIIIIWVLGISIIGIPIVIFILFFKSFLISFTISSFILKYKVKGIILGIIYTLPYQIINIVLFLYLGTYSIKLSTFIIKTLIYKKSLNFKKIINKYIALLVISIFFIIITSLYETYIVPMLINKVTKIIIK